MIYTVSAYVWVIACIGLIVCIPVVIIKKWRMK